MATQENITLSAPQITIPPSPANKWQREHEAFQRLLPNLLHTHLGQYVVIHDGQVVDSGPDDLTLAMRFFTQHGNVSVHIGLVITEAETPVRIPHYRIIPARGSA
jgi:hypothetical protein